MSLSNIVTIDATIKSHYQKVAKFQSAFLLEQVKKEPRLAQNLANNTKGIITPFIAIKYSYTQVRY